MVCVLLVQDLYFHMPMHTLMLAKCTRIMVCVTVLVWFLIVCKRWLHATSPCLGLEENAMSQWIKEGSPEWEETLSRILDSEQRGPGIKPQTHLLYKNGLSHTILHTKLRKKCVWFYILMPLFSFRLWDNVSMRIY